MKINQIIESRDLCAVCGQTPCNCTHVTEELNEFVTPQAVAGDPGLEREKDVDVIIFGRMPQEFRAEDVWAALEEVLPREYPPGTEKAQLKTAEISQDGGAIVTNKPLSVAKKLVATFNTYGIKSRINEGLNEFAPGGGGDDDHQDPYGAPKPEHYDRSIDFFGQFEADHFDDEDMNDATGEFKGYWYYDGKPRQIAYFKFDNPRRTGSDDPGVGWYYEPVDEGMAEATGDEKFDTMMGRIQQEPKYPDPQMPPTDVKDLYQWAVKNNKPYHKIFAEWANREGFKSVAPALDKAGTLDSDALDYWTPDVWKIYWGEVRGIDSEMPPEWAKKRIPDELRDYLETVFDAYDHIVFDWPTEYRQIGQQGMAEGERGRGRPTAGTWDPTVGKTGRVEKTATGIRHHADPSRYGGTEPDDEDDRLLSKAQIHRLDKATEPEVDEGKKKSDPPEADYGADYQDMVARVKKLAGLGPLKTVYDPHKRVYKNVPTAVQPKKEQR